jgi:hypothetical protein
MSPNVLVLANPLGQPMNPLYKTTLREAVAQARMELQELREGKAPAEETLRAYRKLNNLERKLFLARKAGFTRQSDPGTLTAMEEYLSDSNAARGLPSEEFESWSTGRLRRNGLEPNVLLLPNPSRQYDIAPEYAAQQVAAAREEYNRIMKESSTLRLEDPIGNGDEIDRLERKLRDLGKRIQFYVKFTGPTGKKMAQHLRKTSKGRAGLPSKKFEKWSMEPNVLLLPNGSGGCDPEWLYQSADAAYHQLARAFYSLQAASRRKHIEENRSTCDWYMGRLVAFLEVLDRDFSDPATSPLSSDQLYKIEYMKASLGAIRNELRSMSGISVTPGGGWDRSGY